MIRLEPFWVLVPPGPPFKIEILSVFMPIFAIKTSLIGSDFNIHPRFAFRLEPNNLLRKRNAEVSPPINLRKL